MKISTICRYCGGVVRLVPARKIYGASTDRLGLTDENIYLCQNCNARVGCHKGTNSPLGNVANEVLRLTLLQWVPQEKKAQAIQVVRPQVQSPQMVPQAHFTVGVPNLRLCR